MASIEIQLGVNSNDFIVALVDYFDTLVAKIYFGTYYLPGNFTTVATINQWARTNFKALLI